MLKRTGSEPKQALHWEAILFSPIIEFDGTDPRYRAVLIDVKGCTVTTVRIEASGDDEALVRAEALVDGHGAGVDLWDGVRFIEHFPARIRHTEGIDLAIQETV